MGSTLYSESLIDCSIILDAVYHDFFTQFGKTKIFVSKKPEGYGLKCHRAIKTCCEVIGIKDLYARIEGSTNLQHIIKAFFVGLLQQVIIFGSAEAQVYCLHVIYCCFLLFLL